MRIDDMASEMKCNGCGTHMQLDRSESSDTSSTSWYKCPLCRKVRLTSSPLKGSPLDTYSERRPDAEAGRVADWSEQHHRSDHLPNADLEVTEI